MKHQMYALRNFPIEGPKFAEQPLWEATLDLGYPNDAEDKDGPELRNHSIRILVVREGAENVRAQGEAGRFPFQPPLLLAAAATAHQLRKDGRPSVSILSRAFHPEAIEGDSRRYADLRVAPSEPGEWPVDRVFPKFPGRFPSDSPRFEVSVPPFRATQGRVRIALPSSAPRKLFETLSIDWEGRGPSAWIFGGLRLHRHAMSAGEVILLDLVPDGIELDVWVPDPFATGSQTDLNVRLRLVVATVGDGVTPRQELRLQLIGGAPEALRRLAAELARLSRDLAQRDGAVSLQFADGNVPPLYWPVYEGGKGYTCCKAGEIPEVCVNEHASAARILTRQDFEGGELAVAHLRNPKASFRKRAGVTDPLQLNIRSRLESTTGIQGAPRITLSWTDAGADSKPENRRPDVVTVGRFEGTVETDALVERLTEVWRRSGAVAPEATAPYAFLALERGWVQLPLPRVEPRAAADGRSTFDGFMRLDLRAAPKGRDEVDAALPGISLLGAQDVQIDVRWPAQNAPRSMQVTIDGGEGALEGILWAGEGSPSPSEILPSLDAGPAALRSVSIGFGRAGSGGWRATVEETVGAQLGKIVLQLPEEPGLLWTAHDRLALVSAIAMTRTAENALRPSATRELVPTEIAGGKNQLLELTFGARSRLPSAGLAQVGTTSHGVRWRWPWPAIRGLGPSETSASPTEGAGVSLVSLTLPGVEFTPEVGSTATGNLQFSLRYDLPLLDELFATVTAPKPKTGRAEQDNPARELPPTSLEPDRLSVKWRDNARRLARARTQADRVVLDAKKDQVWHPLTGPDAPVVHGIVEPYTWSPDVFRFDLNHADMKGIDLGAYVFGTDVYFGERALQGFRGSFSLNAAGDELRLVQSGALFDVQGFAASSFLEAGGKPYLHDARGLSLALQPTSMGKTTERAITSRWRSKKSGVQETRLRLATLEEPCAVGLGKTRFWFRDLPLKDDLVFDRSAQLETEGSSTPAATTQLHVAKALYEWRLYEDVQPGRYEIPLGGPFALLPLRLEHVRLQKDGTVSELNVIASVQLAAPTGARGDNAPFEAEDDYASGNLVRLRFRLQDGRLALETITRVSFAALATDDYAGEKSARFPEAKSTDDKTVKFSAEALVGDAEKETTRVALSMELGVKSGAAMLQAARLDVTLFGQDCSLVAATTELDPEKLQLAFNAPAPIRSSELKLDLLEFLWRAQVPARPTLTFGGGALVLPLHDAAEAPSAFVRQFGDLARFQWLGVSVPLQPERIDHALGTMTIAIDAELAEPQLLFRGFWLPPGRIRGTIAAVFARERTPASWPAPTLQTLFGEIAFSTDAINVAQRVTAIRHRHVRVPAAAVVGQKPSMWESRLLVDAAFGPASISSIDWPVGCASLADRSNSDDPASPQDFNADPRNRNEWTRQLTMASSGLVLKHRVQPRFCAHRFPHDHLVREGDELVLEKPWRVRVVVDHALYPAAGAAWPGLPAESGHSRMPLRWSAIEEVTLVDLKRLPKEAAEANERYTFLARYVGRDKQDLRIEGVARRTLANAGFPVRAFVEVLPKDASSLQPSLVLTGASVVEMTIPPKTLPDTSLSPEPRQPLPGEPKGVTVTPRWILPWSAQEEALLAGAIAPLDAIPQTFSAEIAYSIAAYDAAACAMTALAGESASAFGAQDGTQALIDARLTSLIGSSTSWAIAEQSFLKMAPAAAQPDARARPIFPRTILGLRTIAHAFGHHLLLRPISGPQSFQQGIKCVIARESSPGQELKLSVNTWPSEALPPEPPYPGVTLVMLDEHGVKTENLPVSLATAISDPTSDDLVAVGASRADAGMRALGLSTAPRIVLLARVDDSYLSIRTTGATSGVLQTPAETERADRTAIGTALTPPPHVAWIVADVAKPLLAEERVVKLRERSDTLHASPTLGWPQAPARKLASFHAELAGEHVVRSEEHAWAGRERSVSWPAEALRDVPAAKKLTGAFISTGQRVAFRWQSRLDLRSPADRFAVLTPPRARMPTVNAVTDALKMLLPDKAGEHALAEFQPLLPGAVQTIVTGQRPGVRLTQHESVLWSESEAMFDSELTRFGRPASRGPVIVRQVRAPRSSGYSSSADLNLRRRTFIAEDEKVGGLLKQFKLVEGPAVVAREYSSDAVNSVTLKVAAPADGRIAVDWNGVMAIDARTASGEAAVKRLARIGLLPPTAGQTAASLHAELQVGEALIAFDTMAWGVSKGGDSSTMRIEFKLKRAEDALAARFAVATALRKASADTSVRFTIRCLPDTNADAPEKNEDYPLGGAGTAGTLHGPPSRVLMFELPHLPVGERWLPIPTFCLAFGDPAYDRELGSPACVSPRVQITVADKPKPEAHFVGTDRAEYGGGETLYFAIWKHEMEGDKPRAVAPGGKWHVLLQLIPADGTGTRHLAIDGLKAASETFPPEYEVEANPAGNAYAISLASLLELPAEKGLPTPRAALRTGDRLRLSATPAGAGADVKSPSVEVGIVAEPALPPPAAVFGLLTLRGNGAVSSTLYATAPLPQTIDFPHLIADLMAGHVRRRGLFLWSFGAPQGHEPSQPFAHLVKLDRTGGGQIPSAEAEFTPTDP